MTLDDQGQRLPEGRYRYFLIPTPSKVGSLNGEEGSKVRKYLANGARNNTVRHSDC